MASLESSYGGVINGELRQVIPDVKVGHKNMPFASGAREGGGSDLSWLINNAGWMTTDHDGAESAVLDSQRGAAIEQMVRALPAGNSKAAFANSIVRALEELQVSDNQLAAAIRNMQSSLRKAKSDGKKVDDSALLDPSGLSNHALKDLLVHVVSASREANAEGHANHDDSSVLGTVVTAVAGGAVALASGVFNGATTTVTVVGGKLAALLGLGSKELDNVALNDLGELTKQNLAGVLGEKKAAKDGIGNITV